MLAANWLELEDDQGRVYFANAVTRETSWLLPDLVREIANESKENPDIDRGLADDGGLEFCIKSNV